MRSAAKFSTLLAAGGLVLLGALSAPALAQNRDNPVYKAGYDQGYRDGLEAGRRAEREHDRSAIRIEEARYGLVGSRNTCDARPRLQDMVGNRRTLDVMAGNDLCGDPAQDQVKRLTVRYRCGDGPIIKTDAVEGQRLNLQCR